MTTKQSGYWKILGGLASAIIVIIAIVGFVNGGVDNRIDSKIVKHEAVFEAEQQEKISLIKEDVAVLTQKVDDIKEDTTDIKRILEIIEKAK